jgi:hypothetical protein
MVSDISDVIIRAGIENRPALHSTRTLQSRATNHWGTVPTAWTPIAWNIGQGTQAPWRLVGLGSAFRPLQSGSARATPPAPASQRLRALRLAGANERRGPSCPVQRCVDRAYPSPISIRVRSPAAPQTVATSGSRLHPAPPAGSRHVRCTCHSTACGPCGPASAGHAPCSTDR